jgi:hypothetical protein
MKMCTLLHMQSMEFGLVLSALVNDMRQLYNKFITGCGLAHIVC